MCSNIENYVVLPLNGLNFSTKTLCLRSISFVCFSNLGLGGNEEKRATRVADILVASKILSFNKQSYFLD